MRRTIFCIHATAILAGAVTAAQAPSFEVASIKRSSPDARGVSSGARPGGRWTMVNATIAGLIRAAYPTDVPELVGAPAWVDNDRYDVNAKAEGNPPPEEMRLMLQSLLADRLKLKVRYETQERSVFSLVVESSPKPGLARSNIDCEAVAAARRVGQQPQLTAPTNAAPPCGYRMSGTSGGLTILSGGVTLSRLAQILGQVDGRVVIDKTGLSGNYEFTLRYSLQPNAADDTPWLFTALREQLGLRLVPDKALLRVLVVEHIERPTED